MIIIIITLIIFSVLKHFKFYKLLAIATSTHTYSIWHYDTLFLEVFIEFRDLTYSIVEDDRIYNVTIVRQGEPGENMVISISSNPDPTSPDSAECKRLTT